MSGTPVRVAVQEGADTVRVAGAERDGRRGWSPSYRRPVPGSRRCSRSWSGPATGAGARAPGVVAADRVARWAQEYAGLAARVRAVPAPLAAAGAAVALRCSTSGQRARRPPCWTRTAVVHRLGHRGGGRPAAGRAGGSPIRPGPGRRTCGTGGAVAAAAPCPGSRPLDVLPVLAEPLGAAVRALCDVICGRRGDRAVLLVGGVARARCWPELVDDAGIARAVVAPRPEAAAVLGALPLPSDAGVVATPERTSARRCAASAAAPGGSGPSAAAGARGTARRRHSGRGGGAARASGDSWRRPPPMRSRPGVLVQYGYRLDVPAGWEHTGGLPERRRVLLTPLATPDGSDLIAVERTPLGYDTAAEPERAQAELRAVFDAAVAGGSALSGLRPGRPVRGARGHHVPAARSPTAPSSTGSSCSTATRSFSVGCRHTAAGAEAVRAACAVVVASVACLTDSASPSVHTVRHDSGAFRPGRAGPAATVRRAHGIRRRTGEIGDDRRVRHDRRGDAARRQARVHRERHGAGRPGHAARAARRRSPGRGAARRPPRSPR